jgi:hypothetical protein
MILTATSLGSVTSLSSSSYAQYHQQNWKSSPQLAEFQDPNAALI